MTTSTEKQQKQQQKNKEIILTNIYNVTNLFSLLSSVCVFIAVETYILEIDKAN